MMIDIVYDENQTWWMENLDMLKNGIYVSSTANGGTDYDALNELAERGILDARQKSDLGALFVLDAQAGDYFWSVE
jgi:hypothetical protein